MSRVLASRLARWALLLGIISAAAAWVVWESGFTATIYLVVSLVSYLALTLGGLARAPMEARAARALNENGKFILYLRSFKIDVSERQYTKSLAVFAAIASVSPLLAWAIHRTIGYGGSDMQRLLAGAVSPLPVVAVGDKVTRHGVAKLVTSDHDWEELVRDLMRRASQIVYSPYPSPGAVRELELIVARHLDKTVFVMPPREAVSRKAFNPAWERLRQEVSSRLELPEISRRGSVFRLVGQPDLGDRLRIGGQSKFKVRSLRRTLLGDQAWKTTLRNFASTSMLVIGFVFFMVGLQFGGPWLRYNKIIWTNIIHDHIRPSPLTAEVASTLSVGKTFRECASCPPMAFVPAGTYRMGSDERGTFDPDLVRLQWYIIPSVQTTIERKFAASVYPITYEEWDTCVTIGGCDPLQWPRSGERFRKAVKVGHEQALQYTAWLSKYTGGRYRLLSEEEWEFAARATLSNSYFPSILGFGASRLAAACPGCSEYRDGHWGGAQKSVGRSSPNAFGLYDMVGHVGQWTGRCEKAAEEASVCIMRGISPDYSTSPLRSLLLRWKRPNGDEHEVAGFRIARDLESQ